MIKAVILDFDGVVVESVDIKTRAFARLFHSEDESAVNKIVEYHLQNAGVSRFDKFRHIYEKILYRPLTDAIFKSLCDTFSRLVVDEVVNAEYVNGAKEFLSKCSHEYYLYIASATPKDELVEIIRRREMTRYFIEVFGAPQSKSDAIKHVIHNKGMVPDEIVFIGDALSDYEAARGNRTHFIARTGRPDKIFHHIDCIKVFDLADIAAVIKAFNNPHD